MDDAARSARSTAVVLIGSAILSLPTLGLWLTFALGMDRPQGPFAVMFWLVGLGMLASLVLMPLVCWDAVKEYRAARRAGRSTRL